MTRALADDLTNWSQALGWAARHDPHLYCRLARGWRKVWVTTARPADVLASSLSTEGWARLDATESATLVALSAIAANLAGASGAREDLERAAEDSAALASDPELVVLIWSFLASAQVEFGDQNAARDAATRARAYADEHGTVHDQAVAYDVSGWVASKRGDLSDARTFAERSIELAEGLKDDIGVCFALNTLGSVLIDEGDVEALVACAERLLTLVEQGRGLVTNRVQGEYLLRIAHAMNGDWPSAASSLLISLTRPNPIPLDVIGDVLTAAAVLSAVGQLDNGHRALTTARQLAKRFEADISEPEKPLRKHLARLENYTGMARAATDVGSSALVPPDLLEALRRVAEKPGR